MAWRLAESGVRGSGRLANLLRPRSAPAVGLVRLPDGLVLHHDPDDYVARSIYAGGYEPAERWVLRRLVRPKALVVDVGANVGIYTLTAARLVGPEGRVVAVEPGPALDRLRAAVAAAGCSNVTVVPLAVGAEAGSATLRVPALQSGLASLRSSSEDTGGQAVGVERLDALACVPAGDIDLLKVDTEGYEAEVLAGASGWFEAGRVRAVLIEVSPEFGDVGYVDRTAGAYGLSVFRIGYRSGWRHRPDLRPVAASETERAASQANYLLARPDVARSISSWT